MVTKTLQVGLVSATDGSKVTFAQLWANQTCVIVFLRLVVDLFCFCNWYLLLIPGGLDEPSVGWRQKRSLLFCPSLRSTMSGWLELDWRLWGWRFVQKALNRLCWHDHHAGVCWGRILCRWTLCGWGEGQLPAARIQEVGLVVKEIIRFVLISIYPQQVQPHATPAQALFLQMEKCQRGSQSQGFGWEPERGWRSDWRSAGCRPGGSAHHVHLQAGWSWERILKQTDIVSLRMILLITLRMLPSLRLSEFRRSISTRNATIHCHWNVINTLNIMWFGSTVYT